MIAEHDNAALGAGTLHAVTAASKLGGDVTVLVAGSGCDAAAQEAAKVAGVTKVLVADDAVRSFLFFATMCSDTFSLPTAC